MTRKPILFFLAFLLFLIVLWNVVKYYLKAEMVSVMNVAQANKAAMKKLNIGRGNGVYGLTNPKGRQSFQKTWSQEGQDIEIDRLLKQKRNGFFIEMGAYDGEAFSNTLFLEIERNWTGLLVEANPYIYTKLVHKKRKCFSVNCCISNTVSEMEFLIADVFTGAEKLMPEQHRKSVDIMVANSKGIDNFGEKVKVQCHSLKDLLDAIGVWKIDFFSLDVEGAELHVLHSIDWDGVFVDVFLIETNKSDAIREKIIQFMKSVNYEHIGHLKYDDIFRKRV